MKEEWCVFAISHVSARDMSLDCGCCSKMMMKKKKKERRDCCSDMKEELWECSSKMKEEWRAGHHTWTLQPLSVWDSQALTSCCWPVIRALGQGHELQLCPTRRYGRWRQGRCGGCRMERAMPQSWVWGGTNDPGPYAQAAALAAHSCGSCRMKTQSCCCLLHAQLDVSTL